MNQDSDIFDKKIFILDDEQDILEMLVEALNSAGFHDIDTSTRGDEALEKIVQKKYDLLLLDIMMPEGISGIEVLDKVKTNPEKYGTPVVVMLTNVGVVNTIRYAYEKGCDGYFNKMAMTNKSLIESVKKYLSGFRV